MVPFVDLAAQYRTIESEIEVAIRRVLESSRYILGPEVESFEADFARYTNCKDAIAMNSGTSALHAALLAAGVEPGDEVISTPMTFVATIQAILMTGARPVLVDVDRASWTIDPVKAREAVSRRTRAILPVHLHGLMADMDPLLDLARTNGLTIIEDAAQAHGATYSGRSAGSCGAIGCFSFYPAKNLGAFGEGGAAVTSDPELARRLRLLRDWGQESKYHHVIQGFNYRMDAIQGAVLGVKLRYLEQWVSARRNHALRYDRELRTAPIELPPRPADRRHVFHVYAIGVERRDEVQANLARAGVATAIHYPVPVHLQPAYTCLGYGKGTFPVSEELAGRLLSLPLFPEMSTGQIKTVVAAVQAACAR